MINWDLLLKLGYLSLPQLKLQNSDINFIKDGLLETCNNTYNEENIFHEEYLRRFQINEVLVPHLKLIAEMYFNKKVDVKDIYKISRVISETDKNESYRGHFDSHIFTLVTPVQVPESISELNAGQLILYPKIRKEPANEFINIAGKLKFKKYSSLLGERLLVKKQIKYVAFDFKDLCPVIFLGRQSFHFNRSFRSKNGEKRITLLTHFFDPSPRYGIGRLNRLFRNR